MNNETPYGAPGRPSAEATAAMRRALDAVGIFPGSIHSAGIDDDSHAWIRFNTDFRPRFAFLLELMEFQAAREASDSDAAPAGESDPASKHED